MNTEIDWTAIQAALAAPFPPEQVSWRVQGKRNAEGKAQVLAYLDARDVQDRLDQVIGVGCWAFDWQPVVTNEKQLLVAKGTITIHGIAKADIGDASTFEGNKGTISDAFKRAGVMWGIGRYLYSLPQVWVDVQGDSSLSQKVLKTLQESLARRFANDPPPAESNGHVPDAIPEKPAGMDWADFTKSLAKSKGFTEKWSYLTELEKATDKSRQEIYSAADYRRAVEYFYRLPDPVLAPVAVEQANE